MQSGKQPDNYNDLLVHDEPIRRGLAVSIAVHVFIVLFFTVKAAFFTEPNIDFSQAVRVDIVGLPDKMDPNTKLAPATPDQKESAKPLPKEETPEPPAEVKPADAPKLPEKKAEKVVTEKTPKADPDALKMSKSAKEKQSSALAKLKAMAALDKLKEEVTQEPKKQSGNGNGKVGGALIKGNVLSPGTALTGLDKLQHDDYIASLDQHIKNNWTLPEWLASKDYKAQVRVYIDKRGQLLKKVLVKSSGNPTYDDYALSTIDKSIPFPMPPEKLTALLEVNGFVVGFPE